MTMEYCAAQLENVCDTFREWPLQRMALVEINTNNRPKKQLICPLCLPLVRTVIPANMIKEPS